MEDKKFHRFFNTVIVFIAIGWLATLAGIAGVIYVAVHFIKKYW